MPIASLAVLLHLLPLSPHPSLFYSSSDEPRLRAAATTTHAEIANALRSGATGVAATRLADMSYANDRGSAITVLAVTCMITGDATICQGAHDWIVDAVNLSTWESPPDLLESAYIFGVAIGYDVLSDPTLPVHLSAAEQTQVRNRLAQEAGALANAIGSGVWWRDEYMQNHNWTNFGALGMAALALRGEVPAADGWLTLATTDYQRVNQVLGLIPDGTWHEGYAYQGASIASWLRFVIALRHTGGMDFTASNPWLQTFAHYRAVGSLPGRMHEHVLMHGDFFGFSSDEVVFSLRYAAARFHDGEAAWLAAQQLASNPHDTYGYEQDSTALEYLEFDPSVAPSMPAVNEFFGQDLATYIARSDYGPTAAVLGVRAGAFGGLANWHRLAVMGAPGGSLDYGHDHQDDLGFWFYANGEWLAPETVGYVCHPSFCMGELNAGNTEFHNTITVDGTGQIGDDVLDRESGVSGWTWSREAAIVAHTQTTNFAYAALNGSNLYPSSLGLDTVDRQVLFVDRNVVVVRDTLHAATAHRYRWHVHTMDGAVQDGSWIRGVSKHDQALGIRVIAPSDFQMDTLDQRTWHLDTFDPDGTMTRVRIWPTTDAPGARFLTVMVPTTVSGWAMRPTVEPLGDVASARGFVITANGVRGTWLFGDGATSTASNPEMMLTGVVGGIETGPSDTRYVLIRGTSLSQNGNEVLSADAMAGSVEVDVRGSVLIASADGATRARVRAAGVTTGIWNGTPAGVAPDPADPRYVVIPAMPAGQVDGGADGGFRDGSSSGDDAGAPRSAGCGCRTQRTDADMAPAIVTAIVAALALGVPRRRRRARVEH